MCDECPVNRSGMMEIKKGNIVKLRHPSAPLSCFLNAAIREQNLGVVQAQLNQLK